MSDLDAWGMTLDGDDAPRIGASTEILQKALALNPALRGQLGEDGTLVAPATTTKGAALAHGRSLTDVVRDLKASLDEQRKAIATERAALDRKERELRPAICAKMIDALLAIDPNMTSPKTAYLLSQERAFLDAVGFSTQRLVERESQPGAGRAPPKRNLDQTPRAIAPKPCRGPW